MPSASNEIDTMRSDEQLVLDHLTPYWPAQVDLEASSYSVLDYTVLDEHDNLIYRSDLNNSEPCKARYVYQTPSCAAACPSGHSC